MKKLIIILIMLFLGACKSSEKKAQVFTPILKSRSILKTFDYENDYVENATVNDSIMLIAQSGRAIKIDSTVVSSNVTITNVDSTINAGDTTWIKYSLATTTLGNYSDSIRIFSSADETVASHLTGEIIPSSNVLQAPTSLVATNNTTNGIDLVWSDPNIDDTIQTIYNSFDNSTDQDEWNNENNCSKSTVNNRLRITNNTSSLAWYTTQRIISTTPSQTYKLKVEGKIGTANSVWIYVDTDDHSVVYANYKAYQDTVFNLTIHNPDRPIRVYLQGYGDPNEYVEFDNFEWWESQPAWNITEIWRQHYLNGLPDAWVKYDSITSGTSYTDVITEGEQYGYKVRFKKDNYSNFSNSDTATFKTDSYQIDYYVNSASGNDANDGLTESAAWETVAKVNSSLPQGKTVAFARGTQYNNAVICKQGCTYGAYGSGNKPIFGPSSESEVMFQVDNVDSVTIRDVEVESKYWIWVEGSDYATIKNVYAHYYKPSGSLEADADHVGNPPLRVKNSDYTKILNSKFEGNYNSAYSDMMLIEGNSQYTLVEDNYIDGGTHNSLYFKGYFQDENDTSYNDNSPHHSIVKNNHFFNHSHHNLAMQRGAWQTLVEGNYFERGGTGIDSSSYYNRTYATDGTVGSAIYLSGNSIVRNNIIRRAGKVPYLATRAIVNTSYYASGNTRYEIWDEAVYNNSFWCNWSENIKTGMYVASGMTDNLKYDNVSFVNNNFGGIKSDIDKDIWIYKSGTSKARTGDYRNNNFEEGRVSLVYYSTGDTTSSISYTQLNGYENITASGNVSHNPDYTNPEGSVTDGDVEQAFDNFKLTSSSALIDAGDYLTSLASDVSSSNQITVQTGDGKFFFDGWGVVTGDTISVGGTIAVITDVTNDVITLDRNITASINDYVTLKFTGTKPDIGIFDK